MFDAIMDKIREELDKEDTIREKTLQDVRKIIRNSGSAIRAIHKGNFEKAKELIDNASDLIKKLDELKKIFPKIYYKNYVTDAQQEFCEARLFYALLTKEEIEKLYPENLVISEIAFLLGVADLIGELRRYALDSIRRDETDKAEMMLDYMSDIYENLISLDYPSRITPGLRRKCDVARGLIEKTRSELTISLQFHKYAK
ncbi:MAG: haloacid dehalogenase [Candidatus Helarchaeota archaeon]|nr:haloacid dehalogenase [Candidatus Helarchaeota archaeon]